MTLLLKSDFIKQSLGLWVLHMTIPGATFTWDLVDGCFAKTTLHATYGQFLLKTSR